MKVEKADLGEYLYKAYRNSQSDFARDQKRNEDGVEGSSDTPGDSFQQAPVMLIHERN